MYTHTYIYMYMKNMREGGRGKRNLTTGLAKINKFDNRMQDVCWWKRKLLQAFWRAIQSSLNALNTIFKSEQLHADIENALRDIAK